MRPSVLGGLVALVLSGAGCLATRPFVRTEVQKSDARTQQQLETVDLRLDAVERELKEERARLATLDADLHQTRGVVEDTAKQAAQTRGTGSSWPITGACSSRRASRQSDAVPC